MSLWKTATTNAFNTSLNGNIGAGDSTITLTSTTGLQSPGVIVIDRVNLQGTSTPTIREYISFTGISGSNLTGCSRGLGGSTGQSHTSGAIVEEVFSITHWNDLISATLNILTSAGALDTTKVVDLTTAQVLTNKSLAETSLTFTDIATNDVSTSKHGFVPKAPNDTAKFLRGDASWATATSSVDSWTATSDAWTYLSASSVTVPSGATSLYQKGDRVKFTQTTVKYFTITAVTDTTLTFAVNTDYTVANAAISAISYSHQLNPIGFPHWFNYTTTPTNITVGNGTLVARYNMIGNICTVQISFIAGSSSSYSASAFTFTAPIVTTATEGFRWPAGIIDAQGAGTLLFGFANIASGGTTIGCYTTASTQTAFTSTVPVTWAANANNIINVQISYKF